MLTTRYLIAWWIAFMFTEIVEAPIYRAAIRVTWTQALFASAMTHPFVWFFFPWVASRAGWSYRTTAIVSELFAWLVEAAFLFKVGRISGRRALAWSFVANGASVGLGLLSRHLFGVP